MKKVLIGMFFLITACAAGLFLGLPGIQAQSDDVVVIVNSARPALSAGEIKLIFTGEMTRFADGTPVRVLLNSDTMVYEAFSAKYLGMNYRNVDATWLRIQVRDGVPTPRKVPGAMLKTFVANSPAFVGFIKKSEVDGTVKEAGN